jgi:hypothetical protein
LKDDVVLLVVPPLVLEKVTLWELYAVSRGTGLGGAPPDVLVLHENDVVVVEPVELEELLEVELETEVEADKVELFEEDEDEAFEELDMAVDEVIEEEVDEDEPPLVSAKYATAPPMATTTITTTAMTAGATPLPRLVIKNGLALNCADISCRVEEWIGPFRRATESSSAPLPGYWSLRHASRESGLGQSFDGVLALGGMKLRSPLFART